MDNMGFSILIEGKNIERLLQGLLVTGWIAIVSVAISIIIGSLFGVVMTSKSKVVRTLSFIYIESIRIIPILVWLFIIYFGLAKVINIHLSSVVVSIIVFSLWGIAEMGDLVRGAITSIPNSQKESGLAIGLSKSNLMIYVIIPQAIRRVIPGAINLSTRIVKTTSLTVLIGVVELVKVSQQIIEVSASREPRIAFLVYGIIIILYFLICYPLSRVATYLEKLWEV
ncbi:MAG: amino acid ABC transporter permease [Clostridium sp.]